MNSPTDEVKYWQATLAAIILALFWVPVAGPAVSIVAVLTAATWYALGVPYAIAVGHVVLAPLVGSDVTIVSIAVIELGFVGFLALSQFDSDESYRIPVVSAAVAIGFVCLTLVATSYTSLWAAAAVVALAVATFVYGIHRYELVTLGLVPDDHTDTPTQQRHE